MKAWHPGYIIALVIIVGCLVLIGLGIDGEVKVALGLASGLVFKGLFDNVRSKKNGGNKG